MPGEAECLRNRQESTCLDCRTGFRTVAQHLLSELQDLQKTTIVSDKLIMSRSSLHAPRCALCRCPFFLNLFEQISQVCLLLASCIYRQVLLFHLTMWSMWKEGGGGGRLAELTYAEKRAMSIHIGGNCLKK